MLSATWNFVKTHKKHILATATIVGGVVGLRSYISSFEQRWQQSSSRSFVSEVHKKGTYFDEAIDIGNNMATKQYMQMIAKIHELFHIEQLLQSIQEAKQNGLSSLECLKYFEKIKLEIFAYLVSEVYVITFFITYLRVQLSITSGKMYYDNQVSVINNDNQVNGNNGSLRDSNSRYHMFVSLLENYQQFGLQHVVSTVRKVVDECFGPIPVTGEIDLKSVLVALDQVKTKMTASLSTLIDENAQMVFSSNKEHLITEELTPKSKVFIEMKHCSKMIDEMLDIVSVADFATVIVNCANIGFSNLYDFISESFMKFEADIQSNTRSTNAAHSSSGSKQLLLPNRQFINPNQIVVPLVKLLPKVWRQINNIESSCEVQTEFTDTKKNRNALLVQYLLCSDSLTCFSANVYEAFCNENDALSKTN